MVLIFHNGLSVHVVVILDYGTSCPFIADTYDCWISTLCGYVSVTSMLVVRLNFSTYQRGVCLLFEL